MERCNIQRIDPRRTPSVLQRHVYEHEKDLKFVNIAGGVLLSGATHGGLVGSDQTVGSL